MQQLDGPIEVGDRLLWKPDDDLPNYWAEIEVLRIHTEHHEHDPVTIHKTLASFDNKVGLELYNDTSRIREACIRLT